MNDCSILGLFLSKSLTPSSNKLDLENMESLCSELNFQDKTPKVMINVISIKPEGGEAEMEKYSSTCVFDLFPRIGSFIFYAGKSLSDYWDMVNIGYCRVLWGIPNNLSKL